MSILIQFKQEQVEGKITTKVWSTGLQNTIAILVKETECSRLLHLFEVVQNPSTSWWLCEISGFTMPSPPQPQRLNVVPGVVDLVDASRVSKKPHLRRHIWTSVTWSLMNKTGKRISNTNTRHSESYIFVWEAWEIWNVKLCQFGWQKQKGGLFVQKMGMCLEPLAWIGQLDSPEIGVEQMRQIWAYLSATCTVQVIV